MTGLWKLARTIILVCNFSLLFRVRWIKAMYMKVVCVFFGVIFLIFAYFQINDAEQYKNGDFWSWIIFYVGTALISFFVGFKVLKSVSWLAGFTGFALGSFIFRMQDEYGNFEFENFAGRDWFADKETGVMKQQTNEAGGLLIVALWLGVLLFLVWRNKKRKSKAC